MKETRAHKCDWCDNLIEIPIKMFASENAKRWEWKFKNLCKVVKTDYVKKSDMVSHLEEMSKKVTGAICGGVLSQGWVDELIGELIVELEEVKHEG